jgi:hypothetical protein
VFPETADKAIIQWFDQPETFKRYSIGLRYTIDDAELIPEAEKESIKAKYSTDPEKYLAELYGRFPDEGKVFKYETSILLAEDVTKNKYKFVVMAHDPALKDDHSALTVL